MIKPSYAVGSKNDTRMSRYENSDFICLNGGREYLRMFEIIGVRWVRSDDGGWILNVYMSDVPHSSFSGDDAREIMRRLGLPEDPP